MRSLTIATVAMVLMAAAYLVLGGGHYRPAALGDPCVERPFRGASGNGGLAEQVLRSTLDGTACRLRVSREELVLALRGTDQLRAFGKAHRLDDATIEAAIRDGLRRSVNDASRAGAINVLQAVALQSVIDRLPIAGLLGVLQGAGLQ